MHAHRGSDKDAQVSHGHSHGAVDGEILASGRGIRATKISLSVLLVTAVVQLVIVGFTGSVALLADTIHNFGDAATALPLWAAFTLSRKLPTKRFNYGYVKAENLAGYCSSFCHRHLRRLRVHQQVGQPPGNRLFMDRGHGRRHRVRGQ